MNYPTRHCGLIDPFADPVTDGSPAISELAAWHDLCPSRAVIVMATLHATTTSNWPQIDSDAVADVERLIADYDFTGMSGTLTVTVSERGTPTPHFECYGDASFDVTKPIYDDGNVVARDHGYTEEFLTRLAPALDEQLVVETVGAEAYRFPLVAGQWVAWPDGTVTYNSFDHSPTKPSNTTSNSDETPGDTESTSPSSA